ncbi:hypothetical protein SUGI_0191870 [Cryptomeria japonica]|uniref:zinc finger CCCH domain-containing protein 35 n=1 Tax=Cryptomeria japonica TaxID=3369 RepID=UPI0024089806|nr:zinc finger CCCH domain-containing protein 35 [Cryptomeria japonica]GLJ12482.1 hypothetical protein SUGI_0191870 [Cryptomeria japonica]
MPGVSSESYMPASFFNGSVNGDFVVPVFEHSPGFEVSSTKFLPREEMNFLNERRFLAKSLSFGCDPLSNGDEWHENVCKEEGFDAAAAAVASMSSGGFRSASDEVCALHKYLPSNNEEEVSLVALGVEAYSCDEFRMYEFKVRRCMRGRSHDWTECPFAHPGEKARRRDPRRFLYCGTACPDFRKGSCRRGDACEFAHGVFECWLHPGRYRTQPCKDGRNCRRRVCFFAHTPQQLRLLPPSANASPRASKNHHGYDGSPLRHAVSAAAAAGAGSGSGSGSSASFDGAGVGAGAALALGLDAMSSNHGGCLTSPRGYFSKPSLYPMSSNSPTSTLVGYSHSQSPPSLSPPLSPAASPPHSPSSWPLACGGWNPSPSNNSDNTSAGFSLNPVNFSEASGSASPFGLRYPNITIPSSLDGLSSPKALSSSDVSYTPLSQHSPKAMADLVSSLQCLELNNGGGGGGTPSLWVQPQMACIQSGSSPRPSNLRHCYSYSLPVTPTKSRMDNKVDLWQADCPEWAEEPVQRVESGRDLRAKIYGRLNRENNTNLANANNSESSPDLGWVNELVK